MKATVTRNQFIQAFKDSCYENNFTHEALNELYDYLTSLEEDTGQEIEFDVVGIACDFAQLDDEEEIRQAKEADAVIAELSDGTVLAYNF
jgi:hypothetical protein